MAVACAGSVATDRLPVDLHPQNSTPQIHHDHPASKPFVVSATQHLYLETGAYNTFVGIGTYKISVGVGAYNLSIGAETYDPSLERNGEESPPSLLKDQPCRFVH